MEQNIEIYECYNCNSKEQSSYRDKIKKLHMPPCVCASSIYSRQGQPKVDTSKQLSKYAINELQK